MDNFYTSPVYTGRPVDVTGRLAKEIRTHDLLDQLNISYQRIDHDVTSTIGVCHDIDRLLGIEICKNLFLCNAQRTSFYLPIMPGGKKFKTAALSKQIGNARLSFVSPEFMEKYLDVTPGSVSALGLMNDTGRQARLLVDEDATNHREYTGYHPCINTSSLGINIQDILTKFLLYVNHPYTLVSLPSEETQRYPITPPHL